MRQTIIVLGILCLLATTALAAEVKMKYTGIAPGSTEYSFTYEANDTGETVITELAQNDFIGIVYPDPAIPDQTKKLQLFFKSRVGDVWNYDIYKGERGFTVKLGESVPIDLDGDKTPELEMEFTELVVTKGTFTLRRPSGAIVAPEEPAGATNETAPSNATPPLVGNDRDEHGCIGSAGYAWCEQKQKCLRSWEEPCETQETNATQPVVTPPVTTNEPNATAQTTQETAKGSSVMLYLIVGVVVLLVGGGVAAYVALKGAEEPKKKK